jgi:hypothetical protein
MISLDWRVRDIYRRARIYGLRHAATPPQLPDNRNGPRGANLAGVFLRAIATRWYSVGLLTVSTSQQCPSPTRSGTLTLEGRAGAYPCSPKPTPAPLRSMLGQYEA